MLTSRVALLSSGLDPEVASYAAAISANGGSVSQTWLRNVNTFVRGCKGDGIWDSLLDVGLLCGADNLSGGLVKLKTPSGVSRILTNNNFVSGDYVATGASAGLLGNGTSKYLNTGFNPVTQGSSVSSFHLSTYVLGTESAGTSRTIMGSVTGSSQSTALAWVNAGSQEAGTIAADGAQRSGNINPSHDGFLSSAVNGSRVSSYYKNGAQVGVTATGSSTFSDLSIFIFASNSSGSPASYATRRIKSYSIGTGLSAAQWSAYSQRINALMASIGAAQYYSPNLDSILGIDPDVAEWAQLVENAGG